MASDMREWRAVDMASILPGPSSGSAVRGTVGRVGLDLFSPAVGGWFAQAFDRPTPAQRKGWPAIAAGDHTLILAPTGSGKTLAAFLWAIDRLTSEPVPPAAERCRVLYVSPLRALAVDVEKNLRVPLAGIHSLDPELHEPTVAMRTGDTPAPERRSDAAARPPDVLITTPESLYLMLTSSSARDRCAAFVGSIVDEIHALAGTKRGAHLDAVARARCDAIVDGADLSGSAFRRRSGRSRRSPGSSAGRRPRVRGRSRSSTPGTAKRLDLEVVIPVEDMAALGELTTQLQTQPAVDERRRAATSIWPSIHPRLLELDPRATAPRSCS